MSIYESSYQADWETFYFSYFHWLFANSSSSSIFNILTNSNLESYYPKIMFFINRSISRVLRRFCWYNLWPTISLYEWEFDVIICKLWKKLYYVSIFFTIFSMCNLVLSLFTHIFLWHFCFLLLCIVMQNIRQRHSDTL